MHCPQSPPPPLWIRDLQNPERVELRGIPGEMQWVSDLQSGKGSDPPPSPFSAGSVRNAIRKRLNPLIPSQVLAGVPRKAAQPTPWCFWECENPLLTQVELTYGIWCV